MNSKLKMFTVLLAVFVTLSTYAQVKVVQGGNTAIGEGTPTKQLSIFGDAKLHGHGRKFHFNNEKSYIGNIDAHHHGLAIISNTGDWLNIGSDNGICFRATNPEETSYGTFEMFLNHSGLGLGGWQCWSSGSGVALAVNGNVHITGTLYWGSDKNFKQNVQPLSDALSSILSLKSKTYYFVDNLSSKSNNYRFSKGVSYGYLAQEVQEVLPDIVSADTNGYLAINYIAIIPLLTEAIKEQQMQIEELQNKYENCCQASIGVANRSVSATTNLPKEPSNDGKSNVLYQNKPNPFNTETIINYFVAENTNNIQLLVFDMQGALIKTYNSLDKGKGSIVISSSELTPGMYLYSLIVDGQEIDTKRMILTQ